MTSREVQQLLAQGADGAEEVMPDIQAAYQAQIVAGGRAAASTFKERAVLTASADWQEPTVEEMLLAALAAMSFVTVARLRARIIQASASPIVEAAGGIVNIDADAYERLLASLADRGEEVAEGIREPLIRAIRDAYENDLTVPQTSQAIRAAINEVAPWQAHMLARTDLIALNNGGSLTGIQQTNALMRLNGQPEFQFKRWVTAHDERVRHDHAVASGQTVSVEQPFVVGGSFMQFPGDPSGGAAQTWNCFPAETRVQMLGLRAVTRRWYDGDLVFARLASGHELSATPNHPVLRADGVWAPLGQVTEGDDLVRAQVGWSDLATPDPQDPPPQIGEIYRLAEEASVAQRVASRPPDFHGDGMEGEVDVVAVDRSLWNDDQAASDEEVVEFGFSLADAAGATFRSGQDAPTTSPRLVMLETTAPGVIRIRDETRSLVGVHAAHTEPVGFGASSDWESEPFQTIDDDPARDAEIAGDFEDALPLLVGTDKVIAVDHYPFSGYIYNLDSGDGWYIANSIAVRNCRCTLSYQQSSSLTASSPPAALPSEATMTTTWVDNTTNGTSFAGTASVRIVPDFTLWENLSDEQKALIASSVTVTVNDDEVEPAGVGTMASWATDPALALEGVATEDGRWLQVGSTDWRELPLTLMGQVETADGHDGAQVAGRIDTIWRVEDGDTAEIHADGVFDQGEFGGEIARMVNDEMLRGVSVDLAILEYGFRDPETGEIILPEDMTDDDWMRAFLGELQFAVLSSQILGATVTPFPAFADARITVVASGGMQMTVAMPLKLKLSDVVTASAAPIAPPREWFETPEADELTPMTITKEGRVFGHPATWDCHEAYLDRCMVAPHSQSGHAYFHTGEIETAEGDLVPIGRWTVRGPHADLNLTRVKAQAHYDDATTCVAFLRVIDGTHGVWACGVLKSDVTPEQLRDVRANPPSGDWRGGELIAVHSVPVAGLPVPRTQARVLVASNGQQEVASLIAAAVCGCEDQMSQGEYQIRIEALAELAGV